MNITNKYLAEHLIKLGYRFETNDGVTTTSDDVAVQAIIDSYDPLPETQTEASTRINNAAGEIRAKFATDVAFQSESYKAKLANCELFKADGYSEPNIVDYPYVNARAVRQSITGEQAADDIIGFASQWGTLVFVIEDWRDAANEAINAETDWSQCNALATQAITDLTTKLTQMGVI